MEVWIICLMFSISTAAHRLDDFPLNHVVAPQSDSVTLPCDGSDKDITWTLNGHALVDGSFGGNIHVDGPSVRVDEVDAPVLGEYVCWSGGQRVSSTFLLLEAEEDNNLDSLRCRAKSYDCSFTCNWHNSGYDVVRLQLRSNCEDEKSCQWVNSRRSTEGSFHFELFHSLSPYAEESTTLELNLEAIVDFNILKRTKNFFLRDIVQPDSPRVVRCQEVGHELNVTIEPPNSWSSPHSFFSLEHQIEYELKDNGQVKQTTSSLIPRRISKFRVRCRDSYVLSAWSQWTPWKNVITGKMQKCKCKNTKRFCCPDKKAGYLDRRNKKRMKGKKNRF